MPLYDVCILSYFLGRNAHDFPYPGASPYPLSQDDLGSNTSVQFAQVIKENFQNIISTGSTDNKSKTSSGQTNDDEVKTNDKGDSNLVELTDEGDEIRRTWYQWVILVLFFQAILCYIPHSLWKSWEGGKLSLLLQNLNENTLDTDRDTTQDRRLVIVNYVLRNIGQHNLYVCKFIFCEFLNLVNIIGQMYMMDVYFGRQLSTYGSEVSSVTGMKIENKFEPMAVVLTKMSKCTFQKYGPTGTIENHESLCILPINIINPINILWVWYLTVFTWTCIDVLFRVITIVSK